MTTVQPAPRHTTRPPTPRERARRSVATSSGPVVPGPRIQRLRQRRRLVREELAVVAILLIALIATLVILGFQWLGSGTSTSPGAVPGMGAVSHLIGGSL